MHPFVPKSDPNFLSHRDKAHVIKAIAKSMINEAEAINLSLGFDPSQCKDDMNNKCELCKSVDKAVSEYGIIVVAAMGNDERTPPDCPAQARKAISVGACTKANTIWTKSNFGPATGGRDKPDIVAPGNGICVNCYSGNGRDIEYRSGTSFSAAIVSGAIALCRKVSGDPDQIKEALQQSATKLMDPKTGQHYEQKKQGFGRINAKSAYDLLIKNSKEPLKRVSRM